MRSIKSSFVDCNVCSLINDPSVILETNSKDNMENIDVMFISDYPRQDDLKRGNPLSGRDGRIFRKFFHKHNLNKFRYVFTNIVLCQKISKTDVELSENTIELCKTNCTKMVETFKPRLIVLLGSTPSNVFGCSDSMRKNTIVKKWNDIDVCVFHHPLNILENTSLENEFDSGFSFVHSILSGEDMKQESSIIQMNNSNGVFHYRIPDKFYTDEYRLVDIQFLKRDSKVLYIFRDKNNNKVYHREDDTYVCYKIDDPTKARKVVPYNELKQVRMKYSERGMLNSDTSYEGDVKIQVKHSQDYYLQNKEESEIQSLNVMFVDIEIYSVSKEFPNPADANHPICMLTYEYNGFIRTFVINNKILLNDKNAQDIKLIDGVDIVVCRNETELVKSFINDLHHHKIDILSGWNVMFDLGYIYNRIPKLNLSQESLSEFGQVYVDIERGFADIAGIIVVDQLDLYKMFTFGKKENYRLGTIAQIELGQDKLDSGSFFTQMFTNDINKSIEYNIRDVTLLRDLENKMKHILLLNQIRIICKNCFASSKSALPQLDSLIVSFLKERGLSSKTSDIHEKGEKFAGAFVKEPNIGIHDYIVDFDFTSLYPSLIMTYNIGINTFVMKFEEPRLGYDLAYDQSKLPDRIKLIVDPVFKHQTITVSKDQLLKKIKEENLICTINGCFFKNHEMETSYYSEILSHLLSSRKTYKKKMFDAKVAGDSENQQLYNIRQLVYKVLANSIYGILGNNVFRFFNLSCAESITASGQEATKTSILFGNHFVKKLKDNKEEDVIPLTREEMYGDFSRATPYVITADTDSLFITYKKLIGKDESLEDAMPKIAEWNDQVQKYLNGTVISNTISKHNVDSKFNKLELKNEMVAKRGLFLAKKRYAINVVLHEGRETDEIVAMGLEIKRSDYPSYTKESLSELLDVVFKTKKISINKLMKFNSDRRLEFLHKITDREKTIARPVSFTKKLSEYKVIPQGVHSMLNWNSLMYESFAPGSRGYMYKISGLDLSKAPEDVVKKYNKEFASKGKKLEVIALPDEELTLPEWFVVDTNSMLKFAWDERTKMLLEPIMEIENKFTSI